VQALEGESLDLQRRFDEVESQLARKQAAIEATQARLTGAEIAVRNSLAPYQKLLERLKAEEARLRERVASEGKLPELKVYLLEQARLVEQDESLKQQLADKEAQLADLRRRLSDVNVAAFPEHERGNAELYVQCTMR
jgi:hypothetical protein